MGAFDKYLPAAEREIVLKERISRFAQQGFQYEMNLKFALESGDTEGAEEAQRAIDDLLIAISLHEKELSKLSKNV